MKNKSKIKWLTLTGEMAFLIRALAFGNANAKCKENLAFAA